MTRKLNDPKSATPHSKWLRNCSQLPSNSGYTATNIDFVWTNYKTDKWMYLEEKKYESNMKFGQLQIFKKVHKRAKPDPKYCGFWFLTFEKECIDDGCAWLTDLTKLFSVWGKINEGQADRYVESNKVAVSEIQLIRFHQFRDDWINYEIPDCKKRTVRRTSDDFNEQIALPI